MATTSVANTRNTVTCVLLSLSFVSYRFTGSSGFYSLFESVFGTRVAVLLIGLYCISSIFGISTIAAGIKQYITVFNIASILLIEIIVLAVFCGVNIAGIAFSGMTENLFTALKIIPPVIITILLVPFIRFDHFVQSLSLTATRLLTTIIIVYWPFTGFEICAIPVADTKDPALIRRSLLLVILIIVSLYLVLNIALIGSVGAEVLGASSGPGCNGSRDNLYALRSDHFIHRNYRHALCHECLYNRNFPDPPHPLGKVFHTEDQEPQPTGDTGKCTGSRLCGQRISPPRFQPFRSAGNDICDNDTRPVHLLLYHCLDTGSGKKGPPGCSCRYVIKYCYSVHLLRGITFLS